MRLSSIDPISLKPVKTLADAPFVVEGMGTNALVIFFENEVNKAAYIDSPLHQENSMESESLSTNVVDRSPKPGKTQPNGLMNRTEL